MHSTNALRRNNDESKTKPKANKAENGSTYYNQFGLKRICNRKGITPSVSSIILPCDPIAVVERLDILMASKAAGNTGVRNILVSV